MKWLRLREWPRICLHLNLFPLFITGTMAEHPRQYPDSMMNHAEIFFVTMVVVADVPDAAVAVDVEVGAGVGVDVEVVAVGGVDVEVFADFGAIMGLMSSRPRAAPPKCP